MKSNRENSLKSTGPRTPGGKAISRKNGLKHGLTGAGIVLPTEDAQHVEDRFETLEAEMKPRTAMARQVISRVALLTVRLDRSAEHEAKAIAHRMRRAAADFDDERLAEVETLYSWIAAEPATNARRLRRSPEGIDRLIRAMEDLRADLGRPECFLWGWAHCDHLHHLLGLRLSDVPVSRAKALSDALISGDFKHLNELDGAGLAGQDRRGWALCKLVDLIDEEVAKLRALREAFDHEGLELDRSEAQYRAMFDNSPAGVLARKYEASTERGLYRALREFRELQAEAPEVESGSEIAAEAAGELGSSLPGPSEAEVEEPDIDPTVAEVVIPAREGDHEGPGAAPTASSARISAPVEPDPEPSGAR